MSSHSEREEKILAFWKKEGIFEKSLKKPAPKGDFTFYDGPPFATGMPHYGHIMAGTMKDVIPRYKTMRGYRVRRRWGWDTHGLPVENLIEKELSLDSRKDIVDYGIDKFNAKAKESVMRYEREWRDIVPRLGRWVDMDDDYKTMDATYTESVWWIFRTLHDKGLIYEGFKSMNICPRCETTLSNFEVAQGYKDITDISAYVKFELKDEPKTYLIAWTTTPWTLPGNSALAINPAIDYSKVKVEGMDGVFILAKDRLAAILKDNKHEIMGLLKGSQLIGKPYNPLFDYYSKDKSLKNRESGWKIYGADFVTTTDGTGIVHIAPAFGADDYELSLKYKLPFIQHVAGNGVFKPEVTGFAGKHVKPRDSEEDKNAHQSGDVEVIKWLAHNGALFEKEKIIHSYPHCWRCDTPLLNYAASSWFVEVTDLKGKMVRENAKVNWVPPSVGSARFGNWLMGARDWAISRSRFWGAPIPVWRGEKSGRMHVLGSVADLKRLSRAKNTYYVMRHGESDNNVKRILDSEERDKKSPAHLTDKGKEEARVAARSIKGNGIDLIFVSPLTRTKETAGIIRDVLGLKDSQLIFDDRIREMGMGEFNGKDIGRFYKECPYENRFIKAAPGGETYADIKKRMGDFLYDLESRYEGKNILIITHETPIFLLIAAAAGMDRKQTLSLRGNKSEYGARPFIGNAEVRKLDFSPLPHNEEYELDLHRPFIDDVELRADDGEKLVRVTDVFDCWFESGAMPYGEAHYPFEDGKGREEGQVFDPKGGLFKKTSGFPADFIAEGLDQTRGWFYSMLVLSVALFGKVPYRNVIVNGLVLAEDGQKMSKRKNNYPDPMVMVERYGADSLRHYLMASQAVRGEELRFSERGVDEISKKIANRLLNVVSFYEMYADEQKVKSSKSKEGSRHALDAWIISRLNQLIAGVTGGLESYELDRAARPFEDFVDDLSTWYLRRSRDRFKGDDATDKAAALATTRSVLIGLAKALAPFMPFLAEDVYKRAGGDRESVHLEDWPESGKADEETISAMRSVRVTASKGLEARMAAKINVRQPLAKLSVRADRGGLSDGLVSLIKDEINVKAVEFGADIEGEVELDTAVTPELKEEGDTRELIRKIQDLRKEKGMSTKDMAALVVPADLKGLAWKKKDELKRAANIAAMEDGEALSVKAI